MRNMLDAHYLIRNYTMRYKKVKRKKHQRKYQAEKPVHTDDL